jgi:serine/threonine protein kinase
MAITIGTQLGSYEITELLGRGGMGVVYRARDAKLGRDVAIKSLAPGFALDADRLARFRREAEVLALLNHPNIATIYDVHEQQDTPFLILELVEGATLAELIKRGPLAIEETIAICRQIAEALEAAHDKGIVHRDLKPANVKITPGGRVKVLDFGLAKIFGDSEATESPQFSDSTLASSTLPGVILGTAPYMSPEQARGKPVDKRADIWAFGCVLYESLTGRQAFPPGETVSDAIAAILSEEPNWSALPATVPSGIQSLLERCLRKDPRRRLHDIADGRIELEDASQDKLSSRHRASRQRGVWFFAAGALLFFLLSVVLLIPVLRNTPLRAPSLVRFTISPPENVRFLASTTPDAAAVPWPALSPDGRHLAFIATQNSKQLLWIYSFESGSSRPLSGTEEATQPFWSPTSDMIAFQAHRQLRKVPLEGGPMQVICDLPAAEAGFGGTWNSNGVILFSAELSINQVFAAGGQPSKIQSTDMGTRSVWPHFLPDGRHFVFYGQSRHGSGVFVGSLDPGEPQLLIPNIVSPAKYSSGFLFFVREQTLMAQRFDADRLEIKGSAIPIAADVAVNVTRGGAALSASDGGTLVFRRGSASPSRFTWFDRSGKELGTVPGTTVYAQPSISPDGKMIAFEQGLSATDVWLHDIARNLTTRLTFHARYTGMPIWWPDGKSIVFRSNKGEQFGLYRHSVGTVGEDELLLQSELSLVADSISPDEKYVIYITTSGSRDIWALPLSGDRKPIQITDTSFIETFPRLSPNGRWLAYASNETGRDEVYLQSFPTAHARGQVSIAGGSEPVWRPDGKELYYLSADAKLMAVPIIVSADGFEAAKPKALFSPRLYSDVGTAQNYDVAPDGRFLFNVSSDDSSEPLTIILNWPSNQPK